MQPAMITGTTRVLGKSQGYMGLPIRDAILEFTIGDEISKQPTMTSAWTPTPKELEALNAGANIEVTILGTGHPPLLVAVGKP